MKVYVVINEANHETSSYYDVIEVFDSEEKAKACIETSAEDFIKLCDSENIFEKYRIENLTNGLAVINDDDEILYESWYYLIFDLK